MFVWAGMNVVDLLLDATVTPLGDGVVGGLVPVMTPVTPVTTTGGPGVIVTPGCGTGIQLGTSQHVGSFGSATIVQLLGILVYFVHL